VSFDALLVGLGNPGPKYSLTRHNIGFILLDLLAQDFGAKFSSSGLGKSIQAEITELTLAGKNLLLIKPQTFMNLSGECLQRLYQKQSHLRELPLIVAHDEVDLEFKKLRIKFGGSDAGHNGLKSIRACLGTGDYNRLRLGVGRPTAESRISVADYVLGNFSSAEQEALALYLDQGIAVLESFLTTGLVAAQALASKENFSR
jgi:PTH1 family peptidyl-tRNA hydrolase